MTGRRIVHPHRFNAKIRRRASTRRAICSSARYLPVQLRSAAALKDLASGVDPGRAVMDDCRRYASTAGGSGCLARRCRLLRLLMHDLRRYRLLRLLILRLALPAVAAADTAAEGATRCCGC